MELQQMKGHPENLNSGIVLRDSEFEIVWSTWSCHVLMIDSVSHRHMSRGVSLSPDPPHQTHRRAAGPFGVTAASWLQFRTAAGQCFSLKLPNQNILYLTYSTDRILMDNRLVRCNKTSQKIYHLSSYRFRSFPTSLKQWLGVETSKTALD